MCEKKGILQTPFCSSERYVRWCEPARAGGGSSHWSTPSLHRRRREARIGGDVGSYVKYAIAGVYDDEEKKFVALATGF